MSFSEMSRDGMIVVGPRDQGVVLVCSAGARCFGGCGEVRVRDADSSKAEVMAKRLSAMLD